MLEYQLVDDMIQLTAANLPILTALINNCVLILSFVLGNFVVSKFVSFIRNEESWVLDQYKCEFTTRYQIATHIAVAKKVVQIAIS